MEGVWIILPMIDSMSMRVYIRARNSVSILPPREPLAEILVGLSFINHRTSVSIILYAMQEFVMN